MALLEMVTDMSKLVQVVVDGKSDWRMRHKRNHLDKENHRLSHKEPLGHLRSKFHLSIFAFAHDNRICYQTSEIVTTCCLLSVGQLRV